MLAEFDRTDVLIFLAIMATIFIIGIVGAIVIKKREKKFDNNIRCPRCNEIISVYIYTIQNDCPFCQYELRQKKVK